ncbi:MAG: esterase [Armatimonadetes bacterium]|nr:esterase [Armatimonadota bacterium]
MQVKKFTSMSRHLGRPMPFGVYGHFGQPLLAFPTASSDFEEFERHGMIDALSHFINVGLIKLYTINSINGDSWSNYSIPVAERARRQALYDKYVADEVAPLIYQDCGTEYLPIATLGMSFGAFHAANTLFKHPARFRWCLGLSGIYDISRCFEDHYDENCYYNNPAQYLPNLQDPMVLEQLGHCHVRLVCGQGPWERVHWTSDFSELLKRKGIHHYFDLWGHDVGHDWASWKRELNVYIPQLFG